jgi:cytochrome b subunit of formate dehydrogenase
MGIFSFFKMIAFRLPHPLMYMTGEETGSLQNKFLNWLSQKEKKRKQKKNKKKKKKKTKNKKKKRKRKKKKEKKKQKKLKK